MKQAIKEGLAVASLPFLFGVYSTLLAVARVGYLYGSIRRIHTFRIYALVCSSLIMGNQLTQEEIQTLLQHTGYWFSEKQLTHVLNGLHQEGLVLRWVFNGGVRYELSDQGRDLVHNGV